MFSESLISFVERLDFWMIVAYFWPFFLIDMTRYLFLDIIIIFRYMFKRSRRRLETQRMRRALYHERPLVSVIIPGKNEGKHIPRLAESLSHQTYKNIEIIIVDDGSDDNTPMICHSLEREGKIDLFIRNDVRGGKASAANTALHYAKGKYIVHIDADSHLRHDSIETILLPFYGDPNIGAVGGDVRVENTNMGFANQLQTIEYLKSISTGRTVSSELGILRIIAGAHGAFRKDILQRLGGWDVGPGLDGDITLKIRKLGYRVVHEAEAICYTNVPSSFFALARQRFRWDRSLIRFRVRKHRDILKRDANFSTKNFIASAENIFFNVLLDIKWWIYMVQVVIFNPEILEFLFVINYILYFIANILEFAIACIFLRKSMRRSDYFMFFYLPLMPIYTGVFLRCVRTYAYIMEFFHGASYQDKWNPWKVSKMAKRDKL